MQLFADRPAPIADPWVQTDEPLIWSAGIGHEVRRSADYCFDSRQRQDRPHFVLQLTLGGIGFYEGRRGRILLRQGMAFLDSIPGPFQYGFARESPGPYELVFVSMMGPVARQWCQRIVDSFGNVLSFGPDSAVAPLMVELARLSKHRGLPDRYLLSARLYHLLMTVISALNRTRVQTSPRMNTAIALVEQRGQEGSFNVSKLAAELGCSREHLARLFRGTMGVGPGDYLVQHRLRLAARELRGTSEKLELIARRCGFSGANYFCRAFRKHFGVTPASYRARAWMAVP